MSGVSLTAQILQLQRFHPAGTIIIALYIVYFYYPSQKKSRVLSAHVSGEMIGGEYNKPRTRIFSWNIITMKRDIRVVFRPIQ